MTEQTKIETPCMDLNKVEKSSLTHIKASDCTSRLALPTTRPASLDQNQSDDTIVLNRRQKIPTLPLITDVVTSNLSEAHSEYEPSQHSDSDDREPNIETKVWKKASQTLTKTTMPATKIPMLKDIRFIDGDIELQQFPQHLLQALEQNCRNLRSKIPTCTRGLSKESITSHSGREACFRVKSTGEKLLQARFKYDKHTQITVVKERTGNSINSGKAVIVTGTGGFPQPLTTPGGSTFSVVKFHIWSPSTMVRYTPKSTCDIVRLIRTSSGDDPAPEAPSQSRFTRVPSTGPQEQSSKSTSALQNTIPPKPNPEPVQTNLVETQSLSMADDSDSDRPLIASVQRKRIPQHRDTRIPEAITPVLSSRIRTPDLQKHHSNMTPAGSPPPTMETARRSTGLCTPTRTIRTAASFTPHPSFSTLPGLKGRGPTFMFRMSDASPTLRSKDLAICNTVHKLFAQASVAGIVDRETMILRLSANIDVLQPVQLIRGDSEDFESFIQDVQQHYGSEIVVLPGDE